MRPSHPICAALLIAVSALALFQDHAIAQTTTEAAEARARANAIRAKQAAEWVKSLQLGDPAKEARLQELIAAHLVTIRDWHNEHHFTTVPAGINPVTGNPLSELDRQMIADSAMSRSVHENLMAGLRRDLTEQQVEAILDKYTKGKVDFTMASFRKIVPDMTPEEDATILAFLKQAREESVDYKNMTQISVIFEIYKTKSEQFLNANGRNWKELYQAYTAMLRAGKAAAQPVATTAP